MILIVSFYVSLFPYKPYPLSIMRLFLTVKHSNTNPCAIRDNHKQALTDLLSCLEDIDPSDLDIKHELSVFAESVFEVYIYAKVNIDLSSMLAKYKIDLLKVSYYK